jgi:hypothetical protein
LVRRSQVIKEATIEAWNVLLPDVYNPLVGIAGGTESALIDRFLPGDLRERDC